MVLVPAPFPFCSYDDIYRLHIRMEYSLCHRLPGPLYCKSPVWVLDLCPMACGVGPKRYRGEPPVVECGVCFLEPVSRRVRRRALLVRRPSKTYRRLEMASALCLVVGAAEAALVVVVVFVVTVGNRALTRAMVRTKFLAFPKHGKVPPFRLVADCLRVAFLFQACQS